MLEEWTRYARWNAAVADEFFSGRYGGVPVYIDLEDDVLVRLGEAVGIDSGEDPAGAMIAAVGATIRFPDRVSIFGRHIGRLRAWWAAEGDSPPPILGVLALQSMVAERMRRDDKLTAANYYGRFVELLGWPADQNLISRIAHDFADESDVMWEALNEWLAQDTATRGVPTAYAFDRRIHVGLPMSQALVRESDRHALRQLFSDLSLRPGQTTSVEDMARLLRAVVASPRVPSSLRRLCADDEGLTRVASVAVIELSAWAGAARAGGRSSSVALTARLRRLPRRSLKLGVAVAGSPTSGPLGVGSAADQAGRFALPEPIALGPADEGGWRLVESEVSIPDLLVGRAEVRAEDFEAGREPRTVIVLAHDPVTGSYREADRIRLRAHHLLLVVQPARQRVERELLRIARAGFVVRDTMPGLPAGWVLFESVEIIAISETTAADLAVLIPVAWTELEIAAGLRLPGRATWHSAITPEVRATAPPGRDLDLTLTPVTRVAQQDERNHDDAESAESDAAASIEPIHRQAFQELVTCALSDLDLEDGDYAVELRDPRNGDAVQSRSLIHLRSALSDSPIAIGTLAYALEEPLGAISAHETVEAIAIEAETDDGSPDEAPEVLDLVDGLEQADELDHEAEVVPSERQADDVPACFTTGAHYFVLESFARGAKHDEAFEGVCQHCGLEKRFPARPKRAHQQRDRTAGRLMTAARPPALPSGGTAARLDYDTLLDALSYIRAGNGTALVRIVQQQDDRAWAAADAARTLMALGHIDLGLDNQLQLRHWSIAPPRIIVGTHVIHLAGWRSEALTFELGRVARAFDGAVEWEPQADGPTRVEIVDVKEEALPALAEQVSERCGVAVTVADDAAAELARTLPALADLRPALPQIVHLPGNARWQRLDENTLSWVPADGVRSAGAYRTTSWPRVRLHYDGIDMRRADSRLAKWLVSPRAAMLVVDARSQTVTCHRGSEPPGLFERALVLCSGLMPLVMEGHTVQYLDVPESVARSLHRRLEPSLVGR